MALMRRFDTFLIGRKTFDVMWRMGNTEPPAPGIQAIVFSRTLRPADCPAAQRRCGTGRRGSAKEIRQGHRTVWRRRVVPEPSGRRSRNAGWSIMPTTPRSFLEATLPRHDRAIEDR
jgi:hypothetical protein